MLATMGGQLTSQGISARRSLRTSVPQAWRHAEAEGAVGALLVFERLSETDPAQFSSFSTQYVMTWTLLDTLAIRGDYLVSRLPMQQLGGVALSLGHECAAVIASGTTMQKTVPWEIADGIVAADPTDEVWTTSPCD